MNFIETRLGVPVTDSSIRIDWGPEAENPYQIATRLLQTVSELRSIGEPFSGDWKYVCGDGVTKTPSLDTLTGIVSQNMVRVSGQADPGWGYRVLAVSQSDALSVELQVSAGSTVASRRAASNSVLLTGDSVR
ncbi:hypothetical protein [Curtobacterium sp. Leaf261]|uniref:hypothetical protein n=1 Tax=Curtobacterium sp. Leaf261 TaxID=1736311 RepID=UPI0012E1EA56|nr:hypothetical protein [Curtobacterium sp. Leaf261]